MMMTMVINSRIIRYPLMAMVIMSVCAMMIDIVVMPEQGVMMMIDAVPIKTLRMIRRGHKAIH
ncbi:hypothetical protein HY58_14525 [Flavihumibacter sp. ZG627]|nr:hypothetical protein HY58_14525 [Flavihumibacter sp. ZG627]